MTDLDTRSPRTDVQIRPIGRDDVDAAAQIVFEAFAGIADRHAFPRDFASPTVAAGLVSAFTDHPEIWGVVAERDGRIIGSNFLDERSSVIGLGPITVDPSTQASGVGRELMEAALERAQGAESVRLLQDSFNTASLALYSSLGFDVVEQTAVIAGFPGGPRDSRVEVRRLEEGDISQCEALCVAVLGFDRTRELRDALDAPDLKPFVARRNGRVVAFASTFVDFGPAFAVGATEDDLFELIAGAVGPDGPPASFLLPLTQSTLLRRCLGAGLRIVKPMTYMVAGSYQRPTGAWIPSVLL